MNNDIAELYDKKIDNYIHFDYKTREEVEDLITKYGEPSNYDESQNDSPTVKEFLELADKNPDVTFIGYVITRERDDYRVSVEGFRVSNLSARDVIDWLIEHRGADEASYHEDAIDKYSLRFWWD